MLRIEWILWIYVRFDLWVNSRMKLFVYEGVYNCFYDYIGVYRWYYEGSRISYFVNIIIFVSL